MPSSGDATSRKCFSVILSRLLCSGSLPTHPSDEFIESSVEKLGDRKPFRLLKPEDNIEEAAAAASTPGVVARLMGLESFPTPAPKDKTLGDYFRSRSVNSIDFLSHFDPIKHGHHQHRRVRTSVSFREGVSDDLASIILWLDQVNEDGENVEEEELLIGKRPNVKYQDQQQGKKEKGMRRGNGESFQERKVSNYNRPGENLELEERRKSVPGKMMSPRSGPGNSASQTKDFRGKTRVNLKERRPIVRRENAKEELAGSKWVKKKRKKILSHKLHCQKKMHPEITVPEVARGTCSRKQPQFQNANSQSPKSRSSRCGNVEVRETIRGKDERKVITIKESCYYKRMVEEICTLTEEDLKENWIYGMVLNFEDTEETCQQFGQEILDVLLRQLVDELVLQFGTRNK